MHDKVELDKVIDHLHGTQLSAPNREIGEILRCLGLSIVYQAEAMKEISKTLKRIEESLMKGGGGKPSASIMTKATSDPIDRTVHHTGS